MPENSSLHAEKDHISVVTTPVTMEGYCATCGDSMRVPNKGLGRANLAAWKSRHQHITPPVKTGGTDG